MKTFLGLVIRRILATLSKAASAAVQGLQLSDLTEPEGLTGR